MNVETIADAVTEIHRLARDVESAYCSTASLDHASTSVIIEAIHYAQVGDRPPLISERIQALIAARKSGPGHHLLLAARHLVTAADLEREKLKQAEAGKKPFLQNFEMLARLVDSSLADFYSAAELKAAT